MLRFTPSNYLTLGTNAHDKLEATFRIANPSTSGAVPFKIKCNRPQLFKVRPHVGVLLGGEEVEVHISSQHPASSPYIPQATHDIRFKVEYALLPRPPQDLTEALRAITDQSKHTHKLFLSEKAHLNDTPSDAESCITVRDEKEEVGLERFSPEDLPTEQRFEYLKQEIDRAEKQRSEAIMAGKPKSRNWALLVIILIIAVLAGNGIGKAIGLNRHPSQMKGKKKPREYGYFGLEKLWAKEQQVHVEPEAPWWKFWG